MLFCSFLFLVPLQCTAPCAMADIGQTQSAGKHLVENEKAVAKSGYAFVVSVEIALLRFNRSLDVAHTPARRAHLQQTRTREAEEANWALLERGWAMITCRRRTLREGCHPGPRRMRPDQPAPMPPRAPQPPPCRAPCGLARSGCWLVRVFAPRYDHSKHCRG